MKTTIKSNLIKLTIIMIILFITILIFAEKIQVGIVHI